MVRYTLSTTFIAILAALTGTISQKALAQENSLVNLCFPFWSRKMLSYVPQHFEWKFGNIDPGSSLPMFLKSASPCDLTTRSKDNVSFFSMLTK